MKVFAYTTAPLIGRHLVGWADIPKEHDDRIFVASNGESFHVAHLTLPAGDTAVTERVILLHTGQSPAALPGWRPQEAL